MSSNRCVACGGPPEPFGTSGSYAYVRCSYCGTLQLEQIPTAEELARAYSEDYPTSGHYGTDPQKIFEAGKPFCEATLAALGAAALPPGRVIDYGCGWGGMARYLRDAGYDYVGVDFESESLDYCRGLGLNVRAQTLDDLTRSGEKFAAILLITVFEHLQDHAGALDQLRDLLLPGGTLLVLIPTAGLYGKLARVAQILRRTRELPELHSTFCPPWHTAIFSVPGFERLARRRGWSVPRVLAAPSGRSGGLVGIIQWIATLVAVGGSRLLGKRWPLVLTHIFVCKVDPSWRPSA